ncbi:AMP-dependent synthetase/ligase [Candidatus Latescibacterota bacterium]
MNTIDGVFRENVRKFPDSIVLRYFQADNWEHITYSEMNNAVNVVAHGLVSIGVDDTSKVAIMCENRPEWMVSYLAIITTGSIAVPIDAMLGEIETEHIMKHSAVGTIICSMRTYEVISHILSEIGTLKNVIILDSNITIRHDHNGKGEGKRLVDIGKRKNHHKNFISYDELREEGKKRLEQGEVEFPEKDEDNLASIIYTSGTTGSPKGVMLSHKNFISNINSTKSIITVYPEDNFLLLLPLHHAFPFTTCFVLPIARGSAISFVDIMSRNRQRLIMECKPTIMLGVPLLFSKIYKGIMRQIESSIIKTLIFKYGGKKIIGKALKKKLGGNLRIMVSGAAPMDPSVIDGFVNLGIEFLEGYGLTETSPIISGNIPGAIKLGSVGPPLEGVEVEINEPDDEGIGEIAVKGDLVMKGYYNNPGQTDKVIRDGWFYTGDLGFVDKDNYIFITGRAKDVIVTRGGKNVFPEMVENVINKSKFISESLVIGYRTEGMVGEDVGILVYPDYENLIEHAANTGITFTEEMNIEQLTEDAKDELIEKFSPVLEQEVKDSMSKLSSYQRISRIAIERDEFIKTSTKKTKRFLYNGRLDILDID